jgi:hypothetical protein
MPSCGDGARRCPSSVVALAASLVGNVRDFSNEGPYSGEFLESYRKGMLAIPRVPMADQVPRDLRPDRTLAPYVSVGWLLDGVGAGRIPPPEGIGPKDLAAEEAPVVLHEYPPTVLPTVRPSPAPSLRRWSE